MSNIHHYLQHYFDTGGVNLAPMADLFKLIEVKKDDYFLKIGQYANQMGFVDEGFLRVYGYKADGSKEVTQWIATKGTFITELSGFIFNMPARWHIQALTDARIYVIGKEDYQKLGAHITNWANVETKFIAKCFVQLENRVFQQLSMTAEERYSSLLQYHPDIFDQAPLQHIASMLGMTPETLSRLRRKRMERK